MGDGGGLLLPHGKCKRRDSLQLQHFGLHKKNRNRCHQTDTFYGFKIYLNAFAAKAPPRTPLGNLTVLPQISLLHLHLFTGGDGGVESGV